MGVVPLRVTQFKDGGNTALRGLAADLAALVRREGLPADSHVSEQWAADALGVSRSPARSAMLELANVGILHKVPQRGFFVTGGAVDGRHTVTADLDGDESAFAAITSDRFDGALATQFTTADISRRYGLSTRRTERVLARMEAEDLIRKRRGRGWEFNELLSSVGAHDQTYRFRMIIEPSAIREPDYRLDVDEIDVHRREQQRLIDSGALGIPGSEIFLINTGLHEFVVAGANNTYLLEAVRRVNRVRRLMEYRLQVDHARITEQAREHLKLLDLLQDGDTEAAANYMYRHLDAVRRRKTEVASSE
jgi:DNA-binding GntR family transcriptional regulator